MKRLLLILILLNIAATKIYSQSFSVRDLITLSAMAPANINHFMYKNGFILNSYNAVSDSVTSYIQKFTTRKSQRDSLKSIDLYEQHNSKYFVFHTSSVSEHLDGRRSLIKSKFVYNQSQDINKDSFMLFEKDNKSIESLKQMKDTIGFYTFTLRIRKMPDSIAYAEDLLQFDSKEFLVSFFGANNVNNDLYYFSEKELQKCSVLFSGSSHQAVFVWKDQDNLCDLSYVIISNVLPTKGAQQRASVIGNNDWKFHSGIYWNMPVRDMLRLNQMDFYLYGNKSELAFMVKPEITGKIDFKKTGIMFSCKDCFDNEIFNQDEVSALDVAKARLALSIFDIIIYP
jgi:hypothetical protein